MSTITNKWIARIIFYLPYGLLGLLLGWAWFLHKPWWQASQNEMWKNGSMNYFAYLLEWGSTILAYLVVAFYLAVLFAFIFSEIKELYEWARDNKD